MKRKPYPGHGDLPYCFVSHECIFNHAQVFFVCQGRCYFIPRQRPCINSTINRSRWSISDSGRRHNASKLALCLGNLVLFEASVAPTVEETHWCGCKVVGWFFNGSRETNDSTWWKQQSDSCLQLLLYFCLLRTRMM